MLRSTALEEVLQEMNFDPSDVRKRILRGEPVATPSPQKTMRSAPVGLQFGPRIPDFPIRSEAAETHLLMGGDAPGKPHGTPAGSPEVDAMRARLEATDVKLASMVAHQQQQVNGTDFAAIMEAQDEAIVEA